MEKELLQKGDKVVMHTCLESEKYNGKIWICATDEVVKGEGCYKQGLVFLENFSSSFDTSFLQKINIEEDKKEHEVAIKLLEDVLFCEDVAWENNNEGYNWKECVGNIRRFLSSQK